MVAQSDLPTVNPKNIVRLSFPSVVFLMRLSFEVITKKNRSDKKIITEMKALNVKVWNMYAGPPLALLQDGCMSLFLGRGLNSGQVPGTNFSKSTGA